MTPIEERHRRAIFGKDFGIVFGEYLREEVSRGSNSKKSAFILVVPILLFIGTFSALRARCHMLFTGRCW